ncbi:MAG: FmdE family protein [Anaerolineae bacterium]|nr:FmdE family protein [Anaerolineae bacterium]
MDLRTLLELSSARHSHLCPRQVLGVRIGLAGLAALGLEPPLRAKRLLAFVETDGCFTDGVEVATGCTLGHRTLRVIDYGKVAAVFVDTQTEQAVRVAPRLDVRERAYAYAPGERRRYFAQLHAYQVMPDEELLSVQAVQLRQPAQAVVGRPGRTACARCGEEIINQREVLVDGRAYCLACTYGGYYAAVDTSPALPLPAVALPATWPSPLFA